MYTAELAIGPRVKRISNALDRKRTLDLEDMDLTSSQGLVLGYLTHRRGEPVYPVDIGKHFGLSHPTVTGILQRLEAKGFITYVSDPGDRRKKRVLATEKAVDCHQQIMGRFQETEGLMAQTMTPEELTILTELLDRIIDKLDAGCGVCAGHPKEGKT